MKDFGKFYVNAKEIIEEVFNIREMSFYEDLGNLLKVYNNAEFLSTERILATRLEQKYLVLAVLLFKGNYERSQYIMSKIDLIPHLSSTLLSCAFNSDSEEIWKLTIDFIKMRNFGTMMSCASKIISQNKYNAFKFLAENYLPKDRPYPTLFYRFAARSSPQIFKYLLETKPILQRYLTDLIYERPDYEFIDPEVIRMMTEIAEINTFKIEENFEANLRNVMPDKLKINLEQNLDILKKHNDKYRISNSVTINDNLRKALLGIDEHILILEGTMIDLEHMVHFEDPFASAVGTSLMQKTSSEIAILEKERNRIVQSFQT